MITGYSSYRVETKTIKFTADDGRTCPKTAILTFFDSKGKEIDSELFGAVDVNSVYDLIKEGKEVNLDNFFVSDFSLSAYRRRNNIEKKELVPIKGFSAKNAFFESKVCNDFSHALFQDGEVSFDGTHFGKGKVVFAASSFGKGNVIFSNTYFGDGNIEFAGCTFGEGDFLFKNAIVRNGIKDFQDIQFGNGEVSFANTEFNSGELLFINTRFNSGRFNFKITRITGGKVDFHYSVFGDCEIMFERTEFGNSRVDFRTVDFGSGRINFNRSVFGDGEVNFEGASSKAGKIQFKKAEMGSGPKNFNLMEMEDTEISFEKTDFGNGDVTFYESKFNIISLKSCHLNHYFDLRLAKAQLLDISDTIVRDIVDLEPYDFPVDIKILDLSGMRLIGKVYIDWKLNRCKELIIQQDATTLRQKAEQFRILKENFSGTGKYADEDEAYIMFKRYEAKSWLTEQKEKGGLKKVLSYIPHGFKWLVFDAMGSYATNPARVLLSMAAGYLTFSVIYILIITFSKADIVSATPDHLSVVARSFYHSAITFFTIGYGDHYPHGAARIVSSIEGFMGVFLMSYFTVAFVRKVLR
ncbi:MAG: potassium channel family protein [Bacteroidia bacterium]|nr:potassium channel family protein [Bacteroidia bacterium]